MDKMPTRSEAITTLYSLINAGILSEEIEEDLAAIAGCIQAEEEQNMFLWGADPAEYDDIFVAKRIDLVDDDWVKHQNSIYEKFKIRPLENFSDIDD